MDTIDERLRVLEHELVRSRRANQLLVIAGVAIVCIAGAQSSTRDPSKTSEQSASQDGSQSEVVGQLGCNRARAADADHLVLSDRAGRSRIRMEVTDDGPAISMFDEEGQKRLELGQTGGARGIRLLESNQPVASLQLRHPGDSVGLEIRNEQGHAVVNPDGFSVHDTSNHGRAYLSLLNGNFPVLGISENGQTGPPSVELTASDSTRSQKMHDRDGHPLFSVVTAEGGEAILSMRHPDHERLLQITSGPKDVDGPAIMFIAPANDDSSGGLLPRLRLGLDKNARGHVRIVDSVGQPAFVAPSR